MIRWRRSIIRSVCFDLYYLWGHTFPHVRSMRREEIEDQTKQISIPTATSTKEFKTTFERVVMVLRWGGTNGFRFFIQFWYAKQPLFWIPRGWVPGYVEWILAFPRAPTGSVSIQMWGVACATAIQLVGAAVAAGVVILQEQRQGGREKMAMGAEGGKKEREGKKEL